MQGKTFSQPVEAGGSWYIRHHGVYLTTKSKKLGWFSTPWTYGQKSLDKEQMSRSDLTNQVVGILLIFREGKVIFMEDIRTKLYHVQVPEED